MRPAITLVTLGVTDLKRSVRFYRDDLGWPTKYKEGDGVAFFPMAGTVLALFGREDLAEDAGVRDEGQGFRAVALAHNARSEAEVDEIFAQLATVGATVTAAPEKKFWGGYGGYFADPDGHLWEVAFNPHWPLDDRGHAILP